MNIQFETAFQIFTDIYGMPNWEVKPKEGQDRDEIIRSWCEALKPYTVAEVKTAAYKVVKFGKVRSFPTLSHILSELDTFHREQEGSVTDEADRCFLYLLSHGIETIDACRTIYDLYGVKKGGYEPKNDPVYMGFSNIYKRKAV